MRAALFACLLLVSSALILADEPPSKTSRAEALVSVGRIMVKDMATLAQEGDVDFEHLLDRDHLKEVDWTELAKDVPKLEQTVQKIALDLLEMQKTNGNAKALVEKYKIKRADPAGHSPKKE